MSKFKKSMSERILHAVSFEVIAIAITAPIGAWILGRSIFEMGSVAIVLSTIAMLLNVIYNMLFDRYWPLSKGPRTIGVRVTHAIGFELSFILIGLPVVAIMLNITLWNAFMLELGFFVFFLFYTYAFNLAFDKLRARWFERKAQAESMVNAEKLN
nr:multidrug/biocide efflux PACE transporter [uncultured Moellerella sp.]